MAQTKHGAQLVAAQKIGVSVSGYDRMIRLGFKWCYKCREWNLRSMFGMDNSRHDKKKAKCFNCTRVEPLRKRRLRRPSVKQGNRAAEAVRQAIKRGILPPVQTQFCICGNQAKNYHHYKGYAKENFLDVVPVCVSCHRKDHWDE